jgi:hypothetical protein
VGLLSKNYYTQLANLRIQEAKQAQENEQRRIEKQESYFERLFQLFTLMVGEEKDERLAFQNEMVRVANDLSKHNREMSEHLARLALRIEATCSPTITDQ